MSQMYHAFHNGVIEAQLQKQVFSFNPVLKSINQPMEGPSLQNAGRNQACHLSKTF